MLEQAELQGIPMGPNCPPNAKIKGLRSQIASEIALIENRAFWVVWVIWGNTCHFGHFEHPFPRIRERKTSKKNQKHKNTPEKRKNTPQKHRNTPKRRGGKPKFCFALTRSD